MGESGKRARAVARVAVIASLAGGLAGCSMWQSETPAPVVMNGDQPGIMPGIAPMPPPAPAPWRHSPAAHAPRPAAPAAGPGHYIVVRPGQSVGGLARDYHVGKREVIAANHLQPPYKIEIGQRLLIPGAGEEAPREVASARPPEHSRHTPEIIPLDGPAPIKREHPKPAPRDAAVIPLDQPAPAAKKEVKEDSDAAAGPKLPHGGRLPWPVSGRVLASYGTVKGGGRNDGINIAAPRGAPVRAVDGGIVAYAGNEVRGYGNLVLIKHANGFISAYAHCEELLVKRGEHVKRGQIIAKVGKTGGVNEPQLHFELRRGEHAVDPRDFLAPRA